MTRKELEGCFMKLSKKLSTLKEVYRSSFSKLDLFSLIFLKMNLEFRKDHKRMERLCHN